MKRTIKPGLTIQTVLLAFLILAYSALPSCKDKSSKKTTTEDSTGVVLDSTNRVSGDTAAFLLNAETAEDKREDSITAKAMADLAAGNAPNLFNHTYNTSLTDDELRQLFNGGTALGPIVALEFKFFLRDTRFSIKVRGVNRQNQVTVWQALNVTDGSSTPNNKLDRGRQFITRGEMKTFLGLPTGTNTEIDPTRFVTMYFQGSQVEHPDHPGRNLMYLHYSNTRAFKMKPTVQILEGSGDTNPSPPFTSPCDGADCDVLSPLRMNTTKENK